MKSKKYFWVLWLLVCLCLGGCGGDAGTRAPDTATPEAIGMANPASAFCETQGGRVDIRETADGQQGFCVFADGSECDEWAFFRGECSAPGADATQPETGAVGMANPASAFCETQGGRVDIRETADGQQGFCVFADGSECDEWAFFRGECRAAGAGGDSATAPVEDWQGVIVSNPVGAQFDDYFQMLDQEDARFGIEGKDEIAAQLASLRDTGTPVHVWGVIHYDVPDAYGMQIEVTRLEISTTD